MKILPYDPKTLAGINFIDDSRLGYHVSAIETKNLAHLKRGIVLLGCADDTAIRTVGGRLGAAQGPNFLRQKLYRFTTGKPLIPIYDLGDVLPESTVEGTHAVVQKICEEVFAHGHEPLVIGGGHDFGFPHAMSFLPQKKTTAVVNIDAHLDVRPVSAGITSGSPWYLLRENKIFDPQKNTIQEFGIQAHCNAHILQSYVKEKKIPVHWLEEVQKKGTEKYFANLLKKLSGKFSGILISFDIDSVRWSDAPGCSAPQTQGFSPNEAIAMSRMAGAEKKVLTFGVFELSPTLDPDGRTSTLAAHCISAYLHGRKAL